MENKAPVVRRTCAYCAGAFSPDDVVAMCTQCAAAHHQQCWDRNGRCSSFRCNGSLRLLRASEYGPALAEALRMANAGPTQCSLCGGRVVPGRIYELQADESLHSSLTFVVRVSGRGSGHTMAPVAWFKGFRKPERWSLPGAQIEGRSCESCRTLYLWGMPVDGTFLRAAEGEAADRHCGICGEPMAEGELLLENAKFWCDTVPDFHSEWLQHEVVDRFVYNGWSADIRSLPAASCRRCLYTEVAGRPVFYGGQ